MEWNSWIPAGSVLQRVANGVVNSHLNEAQRNLLVALEAANEEGPEVEGVDAKDRGGKGNPLRHSLHRTPTPAQQARWEAVQQAKGQGAISSIHRPEAGNVPGGRKEVRLSGESTHQETQRQGESQGGGPIAGGRRLT